jgi:DNA-binding response OmpR family regulator
MSESQRILLIEDEPLVRDLVMLNLTHAGFDVTACEDFPSGLSRLSADTWDVAVVDVMLPGGDGFTLVSKARAAGQKCPILMLTARSDTQSKVRGLDTGADDYLTKPFDVPELIARVRALVRRAQPSATQPKSPKLEFSKYWVRLDTGQAMTNEGEVTLSDKELRLVELFHRNEDRALSRADILEEVWGMDAFPTDRTVDNFVLRLRKLFEPNPEEPKHFITVRGRGYLFRK